MKVSDYIIDFIAANKVSHVFEVCGGAITHLLDSLYSRKDVKAVSMHHEQAAAFAAEGYARASGNIGVAMATSGPGATNLITGIGSAYFDSVPCLFITGQVNTYEFKFDKPVRQIGFQETDIASIVRPITKTSILVSKPEDIPTALEKAYCAAISGRPGPALLDIPMDVQRADLNLKRPRPVSEERFLRSRPKISDADVRKAAGLISSARRPVVLVGGGVNSGEARKELKKFISRTKVPVVSSLMGLDGIGHDNPSFAGFIGTYGNRYANLTIANADLVLALGTRLDTRQTGTIPSSFARGAVIVHVDIDHNELGNKVKSGHLIYGDVSEFLAALNRRTRSYDPAMIMPWRRKIRDYKASYPAFQNPEGKNIDPNFLLHRVSSSAPDGSIFCVDVGQNQMWSAQSLHVRPPGRFLTQGGMGAMGSALAMGIGASFAMPKRQIVVITGDGGFQLNIQELQTVKHHGLPVKIVLLNNGCYGMVRQFQKQYFNSRFQSTDIGYSCPDFQRVVSAYGIKTLKIESASRMDLTLGKFFKGRGPAFLEIAIDKKNIVIPKLAVNCPLEEQDPPLSAKELKSNMFIKLFSRR